MQRRDKGYAEAPQQGIGEIVDVAVDHIERLRPVRQRLQHHHVRRQVVADRRIEPKRLRPHRREPGIDDAVAAGEQGDVMTESGQLLAKMGDDAFAAAVQLRWHRFHQRRDLCDSHRHRLCWGPFDNVEARTSFNCRDCDDPTQEGKCTIGMRCAGNVVLVTGRSRGSGQATARAFAATGAGVTVNWPHNAEGPSRRPKSSARGHRALIAEGLLFAEPYAPVLAPALQPAWP